MSTFLLQSSSPTSPSARPPRRATHRRRVLTALAVVGAMSFAAMSGGSSHADGRPRSAAAPDTVRIALEASFGGLDPMTSGNFPGSQVSYLLGGRLTAYGAGGESGQPELAESLTPSDDGLVWTAVLRPDLEFSDGTPLTSEDVAVSIQRVIEAGYQLEFGDIAEIDTPDDLTVVFTLSRPRPSFPTIMSQSFAGIWPAEMLSNPEEFFQNPASAGRYAVESVDVPTGRLTLVANPNYWGPAPQVQRIEITLVPDPATRLAQVQNGDVDYAHNLPATLIAQLSEPLHPEVAAFPGGLLSMWVNHRHAALGDVRVRQAISLAVDRQQIVDIALGGLLPPDYGLSLSGPDAVVERDLDAARELLVGTACEQGCSFELLVGTANWQEAPVSLVLQQNLAEIGIEMGLRNLDPAARGAIVERGEHDAMIGSVGAYTDAPDLVAQALVDPEAGFLTGFNVGYESPEMHELVQQLAEAPVEGRAELTADIDELYAQDLPFITLAEAAFVNASRLPDDVLSTTLGWHLNLP